MFFYRRQIVYFIGVLLLDIMKKLVTILFFIGVFSVQSAAQLCIPTGIQGTSVNMPCNQLCANFVFQVPHIKSTSSYVLRSIPFGPLPFLSPNGVQDVTVYCDDVFGEKFSLPFPFRFYDSLFYKVVVGSNGMITFDTTNSGGYNGYITASPIPSTTYPKASVMIAYSDLDPRPRDPSQGCIDANASLPDRKVEWRVEGTFPCRRFVVSYYNIGTYGRPNTSAMNNFQLILYESTGIIDFQIANRTATSITNSGRAILGIQDWLRTRSISHPTRNATVWNPGAVNEGWRFIPNGSTSYFHSSQLLNMAGVPVATADTATTADGLLDIRFDNFCPAVGANQYVVKTIFNSNDATGTQLISLDTFSITRNNSLNATSSNISPSCGLTNGTITASIPAGVGVSPYTYSIVGGASATVSATAYTFSNLGAGTYSVVVADASGGCISILSETLVSVGALQTSLSWAPTACSGVNNGTITISSAAGVGPHRIQLDGNAPIVATIPYTFTNVAAGAHTVIVTDQATNCSSGALPVTVTQGTGVTASTNTNATSCPTVNNGSATITVSVGTAPFRYAIDGGTPTAPIASNSYMFNGLSPGNHTIVVTDALGCTRSLTAFVIAGPTLLAGAAPTATTCEGAANGNLIVTPFSGSAPYTFSLDGAGFVMGDAPYTFNNVAAGPHTIIVRDAQGCQSNAVPVTVIAGPPLVTTATSTPALCNAGSTGTITVAPPTIGQAPFEYSLNGINWQTANQFSGLTAGTYTVRFRETNGCVGSTSLDITQPIALTVSATTVPVVCNGQSNGQLTLATTGGVAPYQFSLNGGTNWQTATGFSLAAGNYTITIKDANNCSSTLPVTMSQPSVLSGTVSATNASCNGGNDGTLTLSALGGNSGYSFSIDGGVNWQTANSFNLAPGTYSVTIKDQLNCTLQLPAVVGLTNDLTLTPQNDVTICESRSTPLQVVSNALQYDWTPASGLSAVNIANPVASPRATTQYIVALTLGRCVAYDTVSVIVNPAPIPNAGADIFICYGQSATLNGSGGTVYRWSPTTYLNNPNLSNAVSTPDKNIYYVLSVLSDANGCAALVTDTVAIDVTPPIQVKTFPADTIGYPGDQFLLLAVPNDPDVTSYVWTPSIGLSNAGVASPTVTIGAIGSDVRYKVVASTVAGCKGEAYVNVRVYKGPDIYVPTGFTPNGDGKNDTFTPFPVGMKSYNYFRVFNRWGQLVFQTKALNAGWDGTIGGQLQPEGVYVWMIEGITKDDRVVTKKGTIMLIK
ncbi:MAG: T9SS type B sorting domain-containing protein [Sphingomonadales bacterium]|nr:T9SS type B sorting domain-containing protein [Sphingomonadales bacterium]